MAASATIDAGQDGRSATGDVLVRRGSFNAGSSYTTNGVAITKSTFDLPVQISHLDVLPSAGYVCEWVKASGLVKIYRSKDPGNAGGADIPLVEVANGVDLSAVNFRFLAHGK